MSLHFINLDCLSCGSAMHGNSNDTLFLCDHCGAGAVLEPDGLRTVESTAFLPAPGRHARQWRPAWVLEAEVTVDQRERADGRRTQGSQANRTFVIPAFALRLEHLAQLAHALSAAAGQVGEVPHEPVHGGTMSLEDAHTFTRHMVVGEEVRKADMLASVQVTVDVTSSRLAATPFDVDGQKLVCAVTGVSVREMR